MVDRIKWKKIGGGTFRMASGKIIKPNQEFMAVPEEIPEAFRDVIRPLEYVPEPVEVSATTPQTYEIVHRSYGWYNIIDSQGKKVNEKSLRKAEAEAMVEQLYA